MALSITPGFIVQVLIHHAAEYPRRALEVLTNDEIERRLDMPLGAPRDPCGHHGRDVRQRPSPHRRGPQRRHGQRLGHGGRCAQRGVARQQCRHRTHPHLLHMAVIYQADGIGAPRAQRLDEGGVDVDKAHLIARFAEQLAQEPPSDVPGAKDDRVLWHVFRMGYWHLALGSWQSAIGGRLSAPIQSAASQATRG